MVPEFKEFSRLARESTLVPLVRSVSADLLTPVSAFLAIAENEPYAFLLESAERGEQVGRYTFLGVRPYMRVQAHAGTVELHRGRSTREVAPGRRCARAPERVSEAKAIARADARFPRSPGLPAALRRKRAVRRKEAAESRYRNVATGPVQPVRVPRLGGRVPSQCL